MQKWQPVGIWSTKLQQNRCSATRTFTRDSKQMDFVVEPTPTGGFVTLYFVIEGKAPEYDFVYAEVGVGDQWYSGEVLEVAESARPNRTVYSWTGSDEQFNAVTATQRLRVIAKGLHEDLALTGIASARAPLDVCVSRLLASWGFSAEQQSRLASFPHADELNIDGSDYPANAAARGAIGKVHGYLEVSSAGVASDCHVVVSSGWPDLDTKACELMVSRPKFKPAVDKNGAPMTAPYYFQFSFSLPE
jgi:TonB family protein